MRFSWRAVAFVALALPIAKADQYWFAYEGDDFPENKGWARIHGETLADRWIDNGALIIDGRSEVGLYDYYETAFDSDRFDPEPGETFVLEWRMKVDEVDGYYEPTIGVTSEPASPDEYYRVAFGFRTGSVMSVFERNKEASFEAGEFHEFRLTSEDMRTYELRIDGDPALQGDFNEVFGPTRVSWGDGTSARGMSEWDYVRYGVVPEPASEIYLVAAILSASLDPFRRRQRSAQTAPA